jgi:hypothetical protein
MRSTVFWENKTMASNETTTPCQTEKRLSRRDCGYSGKSFKMDKIGKYAVYDGGHVSE